MDRLLTDEEISEAIGGETKTLVFPHHRRIAVAQRHATLEEVQGIIQAKHTAYEALLPDDEYITGKIEMCAELLKAIERLE